MIKYTTKKTLYIGNTTHGANRKSLLSYPPPPPFLWNTNLLCWKMSLGWAVLLKQSHSLLHFIFCFLENCSSGTDRWCICHWEFPLRYLCQLIFPLCLAVVCDTVPHHSSLINGVPGLRLGLAPPPALREKTKTHSWISYKSSLLNLALRLWHILEEKAASLSQTKGAILS